MLGTEPSIEVVGVAVDGQEALEMARRLRPDVCLLDIRMPELTGIDVARALATDAEPPATVMVTTFDLDRYVYDALVAGASGFVLKDASARTLIEATVAAANGEALISPAITRRLIERHVVRRSDTAGHEATVTAPITAREVEVLEAASSGQTNQEIADELFISLATTKGHLASLMRKTDSRNRVELVIWAYQHGFATV